MLPGKQGTDRQLCCLQAADQAKEALPSPPQTASASGPAKQAEAATKSTSNPLEPVKKAAPASLPDPSKAAQSVSLPDPSKAAGKVAPLPQRASPGCTVGGVKVLHN